MSLRKPRSRGLASLEAAVVIPFFIITLVSLFYVRNLVIARQHAEAKTRSCVWLYSANNCVQVPPGCEETLLHPGDGVGDVDGQVEQALDGANFWPVSIVVSSVLEPVLRSAFGRAATADTSITYERPRLYGGGSGAAIGSYYLACNLAKRAESDVIKETWDAILDAIW